MENETTQIADQHNEFHSYTLDVFEKSFDSVTALIADKFSTNRVIASKFCRPLLGRSSNRFPRAVCQITSDDEDVIKQAHSLMTKFRTPLLCAKLYEETTLRVKLSNDMRWASVYAMLKRHFLLRDSVYVLDSMDLNDVLLTASFERRFNALCSKLE